MDATLLHYLTAWKILGYGAIFLGMIFEGDAVLFTAAFLAHQGFFDPLNMFVVVLCGILIGDSLWYLLGHWLNTSSAFFTKWAARIAAPFDQHLLNSPFRTIFISKFTYGFHHAILVRAGSLGLPWKNILETDIPASLLWITIVGGLGYASGAAFVLIKHYLRFAELGLLAALIIFIAAYYLIVRSTKKRL
ncbi:MAG: VTT domain-containing protein [Parcubacteria group bacterium]|nr:VTT domain-containing protein [Parcubacteria group bacterium]